MQIPPPEVLSTFPPPNYIDPVTRGPAFFIITVVFLPIIYIVVGLRTFTRIYLSRHFGVDDIFLLIALIPTTACAVGALIAQEKWKWKRHVWDMTPDDVQFGLKMYILLECLFGLAVALTKISLIILVMRVMSRGTGPLRNFAIAMMVFVTCEAVSFEIVVINNCSPISDYWKLSYSPQNCVNEQAHLLASAIINTCSDFLVFFLPIPTVFSLPIPFRQQFMLCLLFATGLVVCGAGVVRVYYIHTTYSSYDKTWFSYPLWISSILNLYIGIICTALPATKPFFSTFLPSLFGSSSHSETSSRYKLSTHQAAPFGTNQSQVDLKPPQQSFNISEIPDPQAGGTGISDDARDARNMLPLSYLSSHASDKGLSSRESSNRGSVYRQSSSKPPSNFHQSDQSYNTRDIEFGEASMSIGSHLGRGSGRLSLQSTRTQRNDRGSISTLCTDEHGSPRSSRFASSLMEVPHTPSSVQYGITHEPRATESQDFLIHAR